MAKQEHKIPVSIGTISKSENIYLKFLESILLTLCENVLLASKKGKGGGYYLLKESAEIQMTTLMRVLERPIFIVPCVSLNFYEKCNDCQDEKACAVDNLMIQVRDISLQIFRNTTLADLSA